MTSNTYISLIYYCFLIYFCFHIVSSELNITRNRSSKFFPFFSIIRFPNTECFSSGNFNGTCLTRRECKDLNGLSAGSCASKRGVCCIVQRTCGGNSNINNTYFTNMGYPNSYIGGGSCTIFIQRCNSGICQVRLEFLDLILAQPNGDGQCINDYISITGGSSLVPRFCGENTGQHIYINFNSDNNIIITITSNALVSFNRRWSIKISQLACDCPFLVPNGCLMYYTGISGIVRSFNYGTAANIAIASSGLTGTRQISNLNYGICIRMEAGYCGIRWSQTADPYSFTVSDNVFSVDNSILGTPNVNLSGTACPNDFVVIPNPNGLNYDRFCGLGFPEQVTTFAKPFVLTVVTNQDEGGAVIGSNPDAGNRGFVLQFIQEQCQSN